MRATRDIIEEIIQARSRRKSDSAMFELFMRLSMLERAFKNRGELDAELLKYFPVALVACLEAYSRLAIKEMIDAGSPFLDHSAKLLGNAKLDFDILKALHGKQITIGEFIAHNIPISRLSHINHALSALLEKDMLTELRTVADRWSYEVQGNPKTPILSDPDGTYTAVSKTFELRHIICHEMASNYEVEVLDIERGFTATAIFLKATDELISETLHPNAPLTQTEMNIEAGAQLDAALHEVDALSDNIKNRLNPERVEQFAKAYAAWRTYMEIWAQFEADFHKGGTIWPTIYCGSAAAIAQSRIDQLKEYLHSYELAG
jgi:hypothetical protein